MKMKLNLALLVSLVTFGAAGQSVPTNYPVIPFSTVPLQSLVSNQDAMVLMHWTGSNYISRRMPITGFTNLFDSISNTLMNRTFKGGSFSGGIFATPTNFNAISTNPTVQFGTLNNTTNNNGTFNNPSSSGGSFTGGTFSGTDNGILDAAGRSVDLRATNASLWLGRINSGIQTSLMAPLLQKLQSTTNGPLKILFIGDSMMDTPSGRPTSTSQAMISDLGKIYGPSIPYGWTWSSFTCTANPSWVNQNWWTEPTWAMTSGQSVTYGTFSNVNSADFAWLIQPQGNATLGIYTNGALCKTVNGFSLSWAGGFTNIALPTGDYNLSFQSSGAGTNLAITIGAHNTNGPGFVFYVTSQGGASLSNLVTCPSSVLTPIYGGISPDLVIYHAKDWEEPGVDQTESGLDTMFTNAYNDLQGSFSKPATWCIVGTPDANYNGEAFPQNDAYRRLCISRGFIYADAYIPFDYYKPLSADNLHPNSMGATIIAKAVESSLGLTGVQNPSDVEAIKSLFVDTNAIPSPSVNTSLGTPIVNNSLNSQTSHPTRVVVIGDTTAISLGNASIAESMEMYLLAAFQNHWCVLTNAQALGAPYWNSFTCIPNPAWAQGFVPNGVCWGLTNNNVSVTYNQFTNVNWIEVDWLQSPYGNANLGIYTNGVLCATLNGFSAATNAAFTNITVPTGSYIVKAQNTSAAAGVTNVVYGISAQNFNSLGFAFYYFPAGSLNAADLVGLTNTLGPILSGIAPDMMIGVFASGITNSMAAMISDYSAYIGSAPWFFIGEEENNSPALNSQFVNDGMLRSFCQGNNCTYIDCYLPWSFVSPHQTGLIPDQWLSDVLARSALQQMGLFGPQIWSTLGSFGP